MYQLDKFLKCIVVYVLGLAINLLPREKIFALFTDWFPNGADYVNFFLVLGLALIIFIISENLYQIKENVLNDLMFCISAILLLFWLGLFKNIIFKVPYISFTWASPIFLVVAYVLFNEAYFHLMTPKMKQTDSGFDNPISTISKDHLNRKVLANRVFETIKNSPKEWSNRLGICGEWGAGKTSLMKLVKELCIEEKYCTIWFNPWVFKNKEELWIGFRSVLETGLAKYKNDSYFPSIWFKIKTFCMGVFRKKIAQFAVGKALDDLIEGSGGSDQSLLKKNVESLLRRYVDTKIVVFIDDLDRVEDGKVLLDILRGIKEVVDFSGLSYVIGFDDNVISQVIETQLPQGTGKLFLDKIITSRIEIPAPLDDEFKDFLRNEISKYELKNEALINISETLPRNPRTLKKYIRTLVILQPTLNQFNSDELDWELLYIAQLITTEFPFVSRRIATDQDISYRFTSSGLLENRLFTQSSPQTEKEKKEQKEQEDQKIIAILLDNPDKISESDKKRLLILINCFRMKVSAQWRVDASAVSFYFRFLEIRNSLPHKKFDEYYLAIEQNNLEIDAVPPCDVFNYLLQLFNKKQLLLGKINQAMEQKTIDEMLNNIAKVDSQINKFIIIEQKSLTDSNKVVIFTELCAQSVGMMEGKINNIDPKLINVIYEQITNMIRENGYLSLDFKNGLFQARLSSSVISRGAEAKKVIKRVENALVPYQIESILQSFEIKKGIESIIVNQSNFENKKLLFQKSPFYEASVYEKLVLLAEKVHEDSVIRENFRDYFIYLLRCTAKDECIELGTMVGQYQNPLKEPVLLNLLYQTYNAVPLSANGNHIFEELFRKAKDKGLDVKLNIEALTEKKEGRKEIVISPKEESDD